MVSLPLSASSWQFRDATAASRWRTAEVPGCVHLDLRRHELIPDPFWADNELGLQWIEEHDWEYRTTFTVGAELLTEEVVELVADGLDTVATVFLNDREIARTDNMFVAHRWDVKPHLRRGRNTLRIHFSSAMGYIRTHRTGHQPREFNDPVGRCTVIRKQQCQFGWDWGPRLVTAGIWKDIRLEGWSGNRLESVRVRQHHAEGRVRLELSPELARAATDLLINAELTLDGQVVAEVTGTEVIVPTPRLWWPAGQGEQPLYHLTVEVHTADGTHLGTWAQRIGLRTIALDRHQDEWGESFQFLINGRPVFAKGANWIPAHTFVPRLGREDYARDLRAAVAANMNMIRVWGGGIYESEHFYDLCDELGLLVWQDFMFACTHTPADDALLASTRAEVASNVRRLRHRASLALWCGNNEIWAVNAADFLADTPAAKALRADYERLFHDAIPAELALHDTVTPYWPSSPWRGDPAADHATGEKRGDTHYWDVWHARHPVKDYEKWALRFVSEFGMQSYSSPETNATFCPPGQDNVFGALMENHQKNRAGNQIILDYVSRRYRFPKDQDALIYLSQLNQAYCMQTGVEHYRRLMPRCMGALYWQLNDCWPVASWSSIEFTGRWKALHHVARRFFAPYAVSAHVPGDETTIIGNYRRTTVDAVLLYTVCDAPVSATGVLRWDLFHLDGRVLTKGRRKVTLQPGAAVRQHALSLASLLDRHSRDRVYLRIALDVGGRCVSEDTVFLTPPRFIDLPRGQPSVEIRRVSAQELEIHLTSTVFQHRFAFDLPGLAHEASDNYFELYAGETKTITVRLARPLPAKKIKIPFSHVSLADTY